MEPMRQDSFLSIQKVVDFYGLEPRQILDWISQGKLKLQKLPDGTQVVAVDALKRLLQGEGILSPQEGAQSLKVLLVDDEPLIRRVLRRAISEAWPGTRIEEAASGFDAGKMMVQLLPDFIILDIALPGLSGHEVLASVRADRRLANTIVIAITGYDTPETEKRMLDNGASAFLAKPFDPTELVSAMGELLAKRRG